MTSQRLQDLFHRYIGHLFVISYLYGGYIYNLKFIQLGIPDLGKRVLGIDPITVGLYMALLAVITAIVAIVWGMRVNKLHLTITRKIDILIVLGLAQMGLTFWAGVMTVPEQLPIWIVLISIALGIGIPITITLLFELIPQKDRGIVAGLITGLAFFIGNISQYSWDITGTTQEALFMMVLGSAEFLLLRFLGFFKKWFPPREDYTKYTGRFSYRPLIFVVILMFTVFFVDSLGFLRIIGTSSLYNQTWHADMQTRTFLGVVHLLAGLGAGYLYSKTNEWTLGILALGLFMVVDVIFSLYPTSLPSSSLVAVSSLYCATVSIYTVNNFAIWVDVSTKDNVTKNAALGIGIGGWLSSFLSTMLAEFLAPAVSFQVQVLIPSIIAGCMLVVFALLLKKRRVMILGINTNLKKQEV